MIKYNIGFTVVFLCSGINAQNLDVEGKMQVRDINTIATFQSKVKNSFIRLATNDEPLKGTNIGYFDDGNENYFYIDTPEGEFGEFTINNATGHVNIGANIDASKKLNVWGITGQVAMIPPNFGSTVHSVNAFSSNSRFVPHLENSTAISGASVTGYGLYGASGQSVGVYGRGDGDSDFWAENGSYGGPSSIRWKTNIINIPNPLQKINKLRGVYFDWDSDHGGSHAVGFIAEEIGEVLPEIVFYEENGIYTKGMDYSKITPLLVEVANAMRREYQGIFDEHRTEINTLKMQLAELKSILKSKYNLE